MKYKVIKKENGKIMESVVNKEISNSPYLEKNERCFPDYLYSDYSYSKKEYVDDINVSSVSYREIKFNNVIISKVTPANENENGGTE